MPLQREATLLAYCHESLNDVWLKERLEDRAQRIERAGGTIVAKVFKTNDKDPRGFVAVLIFTCDPEVIGAARSNLPVGSSLSYVWTGEPTDTERIAGPIVPWEEAGSSMLQAKPLPFGGHAC